VDWEIFIFRFWKESFRINLTDLVRKELIEEIKKKKFFNSSEKFLFDINLIYVK